MSQRVDYFKNSSLASHYKKYREDMSDKCVKRILQFLEEKFKASECTAVDVGCGSGQATKTFAPYLNEIIGVDSSEAQLSEVSDDEMPKNITFRYGRAEALPVDDKSVHLVTATLAAHWFNYPAFIEEVDRVLVPGGVLALTGTDRPIHLFGDNPEVEEIIQELRDAANENLKDKDLEKGWHSTFYKTVELPYKCFIRDHSVEVEKTTTLSNFINTFRTFTYVGRFLTEEPEKAETALQRFHDRLIKSFKITTSPEDVIITYKKRYIVLLSRKPEN